MSTIRTPLVLLFDGYQVLPCANTGLIVANSIDAETTPAAPFVASLVKFMLVRKIKYKITPPLSEIYKNISYRRGKRERGFDLNGLNSAKGQKTSV